MDYAGADADSMFEDTGHSVVAREDMKQFVVGRVKSANGSVTANKTVSESKSSSSSVNVGMISILVLICGVLYAYISL